ncbi:MAG: hypothetical protein COB85_04400 [Bacteroidetes bacterium]|nr:MAG: hypothetical protein COB85_04400 [Bacteroidota bacterium]
MKSNDKLDFYKRFSANGLVLLVILFGLLLAYGSSSAQQLSNEEGLSPKELFKSRNYITALPEYVKMVEKDPENMDFKYKLAQCYLYLNVDKSRLIPLLEEVCSKPKHPLEAIYDLGKAYHLTHNFDKAIKIYTNYKSRTTNMEDIAKAAHQIEMCHNGKELIKYPIDITFELLGKNVNSPYPDFTPRVPSDESFIVFTSRRKSNKGSYMDYDGYAFSDVYMCRVKKGKFSRAANVSTVNSESDEEVAGISPDGKNVLIFVDDMYQNIFANIYVSKKRGRSLRPITALSDFVNTPTTLETSAAITSDGQLLYFSSNVKGGFGGMDLYVSRLMPDESWGEVMNLGPAINTKYDEEYPSISFDGNTMYFSSEGHTSMGGYDLFKSVKDPASNSWSAPVNLGYPLNTADDNMNICFTAIWDEATEKERNKYAYISAYREEGMGDLDIYRVVFNKIEPRLTAITGTVTSKTLEGNIVYKTFHVYSKGEEQLTIPDECHPWFDKDWTYSETNKVKVKPGHIFKTSIFYEMNGQRKRFSSKKYPKNKDQYVFKQVKSTLVKIPNYVEPEKKYVYEPLTEAMLIITDKNNMNEYTYTPAKSGRYVIILPPGSYNIFVDVPNLLYLAAPFSWTDHADSILLYSKGYV